MWSRFHGTVLACAVLAAASAPAMSAPKDLGTCRVLQAEKLPADAGSEAEICSAIQRAIATRAPAVRYTAEVRVLSKSALAATIVADGRKLPEQHFGISDGRLSPRSIERFAAALADEVAKAGKS
jgi:hypothetical protein